MKIILVISASILMLVCCTSSKKVILDSGVSYWGEFHAGNTTTLQTEYEFYEYGGDTIGKITHYYTNGKLKSKITMVNELLMDIEFVLDTLGNTMDFGTFENGNGYVIQFDSDDGSPEKEGNFVNGNREGWWKDYHFSGSILDSNFYINGYIQRPPSTDTLSLLLDLFGTSKYNYYR